MERIKKWPRAELLIFTIITIMNMLPFVATRFFPSMDGASHLSNANIISQLIFHNNSLFHQFFMINPEPVPNWTAHLLIALLTIVMPAFLAEKLMIILLLIGTPFAFRTLMQTVSPKNTLFSFLIFPFTHSMFFFFGFFNFCMAILFYLITFNYWLRHEHEIWKIKKIVTLLLLVTLTYFSHIVIFGTLLLTISFQIITGVIAGILSGEHEKKMILRQFLNKALAVTLTAILPILLFVYFFYSRPGIREITHHTPKELINDLVTIRPLISLNLGLEGKKTIILFYLFVVLTGVGVLVFLRNAFLKIFQKNSVKPEENKKQLPGSNFWWLFISMSILLVLYFKLPDAYGTASYINLRIGFVFFLLTILWLSTFRIPWYFGLIAAITGLYVNTMLIRYNAGGIKEMGKLAVSCNKAADFIAPNSVVLPIYCLNKWFAGHFVDYLAIDKPIVMVYNYECESGYFPVKWNEKSKPNYYLGNPAIPEKFVNFELTKGNPYLRLDYVFIMGLCDPAEDRFFIKLNKILSEDFVRVYSADSCSLYKNKMVKIQ
ncbi:MAG: hypothetical protein WCK09_05490 [Bacteroidota bacterium]